MKPAMAKAMSLMRLVLTPMAVAAAQAVAAGREDVVAEAVAMQQRPEHQAKHDEPDEGGVDAEERAGEQRVEDRVGIKPHLHRAIDQAARRRARTAVRQA
jgi:hypothetical protein